MNIIHSITLLVIFGATVLSAPPKNCNKNLFDKHAANVFAQFGLEELQFPDTSSELGSYCKKAKESIDFSKQYGENCLKGTSQTLMSLASYNFNQVNKPYCSKNGKKKEQFVEWAKCGNPAKKNTKKCWGKMILDMAMAGKVTNSKSRIPIICCSYYQWIKCTKNQMEAMGTTVCPKETVDGYTEFINKASVDSMKLICNKYEDDDSKCTQLLEEVPKEPKPKKLQKTPLLYIFDVFDKL